MRKQPTSHNKRENEMRTRRNAAAPQSRFARPAFKNFAMG